MSEPEKDIREVLSDITEDFDTRIMEATKLICNKLGHNYENDQCGIKNHRLCRWCMQPEFPEAYNEK